MRDDYHSPVPIPQVSFEPFYGVDIQMVAGFIQQEQVRVIQQDSRQASPGALTTRKLLQWTLVIGLRKPQSIQCLADARVIGVATTVFKDSLDLAVSFQHGRITCGVLHQLFQLPQFFPFGDQILKS